MSARNAAMRPHRGCDVGNQGFLLMVKADRGEGNARIVNGTRAKSESGPTHARGGKSVAQDVKKHSLHTHTG